MGAPTSLIRALNHLADVLRDRPRAPARAEDDGISSFERNENLENERGHWVGGRDQANDDANRAGQFGHVTVGVEADLTVRCCSGQLRVDAGAGDGILHCLVVHVAHPGFVDSRDCQRVSVISDDVADPAQQHVDLAFAPIVNLLLRRGRPGDQCLRDRVG
jgi:hypothetical protein